MGKSLDEALDGRMQSGGDYSPWWPDDASELEEGASITGIVRSKRDDPFWEEDDDDGRDEPAPILEVQTEDNLFSTRTHRNLVDLIESQVQPAVGDLVRIEYAGKYTAEGGTGYNYKMGKVTPEEFGEYDIDPDDFGGEASPPPESGTSDSGSDEPEELDPSDVAGDDDEELGDFEEEDSSDDGEISKEVTQFVEQLMDYNYEMSVEELDDYLNDVREFGVDAEEAAIVAGFSVEDGVVS